MRGKRGVERGYIIDRRELERDQKEWRDLSWIGTKRRLEKRSGYAREAEPGVPSLEAHCMLD